ncbi:hypothetical protein J921_3724 [Acinetobacter baumannii 25493_8]|uniref:Uncharacterized protein n=3 Tax=Acinetobacter baumannii TaxID=470 RepID=A0AAP1QWB6_ACIBA|nr:hypothetical protein [Acinetobacter baumannii]EYD47024.1 hypothetical protein J917_3854 [Acinetobacter baumannii 25493_4]EYS10086.1 hypothetical protein K013_3833 [Acinetobacter baumannii 25569_7]EHU2137367.1 hypothetical protein [Acinetobacter baumannii]EIG0126898.1 hypothetical protein [Acinetobacter baumannii]EKW0952607.1 hypothetical protein [Acinetobacter baumannii]
MSFITVDDANSILGSDFAPDSDKARLVQLANVWMKKRIGFVPDPIDPLLKDASCEIIKGILAKEIYNGKDQQLKRKKVKADSVESEKEYQDGSEAISSFEQIAIDFIDSLDLKDPNASFNGFGIPLYRA